MGKQNINVALDLDMLLTQDSDDHFYNYLLSVYKIDKQEYDFIKDIQKKYNYANTYHAAGESLNLRPTMGARDVLRELRRVKGYNFNFVIKTDRNFLYSQRFTDIWVQTHYGDVISRAHCTEYNGIQRIEDKADFCTRFKAHIFIDDHWGHINATSQALPHTLNLLYTQERNSHVKIEELLPNCQRVNDWQKIKDDILDFLPTVK